MSPMPKTMSGLIFTAVEIKSSTSSDPKPTDVRIEIAVFVLDAGHGIRGNRRGPRISRAFSCKAMKRRRGDSFDLHGKARTGEDDA